MKNIKNHWVLVGCLIALAIGVVDYWTLPTLMLFYLAPSLLTARRTGLRGGLVVAVFSAFVWGGLDILQAEAGRGAFLSGWNLAGRILLLGTFSVVLTRMLAAQEEAEQVKQFLVHDLRSPLTNTVSGLMILRDLAKARQDESEIELAEIGIVGGKRVLTLIDAILDTERMSNGKMPVQLMEVSPNQMIEEAIQQVSLMGDRTQILIENRSDPNGPKAIADPLLTERVLVNLMSNAIKVCPPMSVVTVSAAVENRQVRISVADNGPGMKSEDAQAVFAKYSQARKDPARHGTGLGLTFCRLAVESQEGHIDLKSELGKGTVVTFTLPQQSKTNQHA